MSNEAKNLLDPVVLVGTLGGGGLTSQLKILLTPNSLNISRKSRFLLEVVAGKRSTVPASIGKFDVFGWMF